LCWRDSWERFHPKPKEPIRETVSVELCPELQQLADTLTDTEKAFLQSLLPSPLTEARAMAVGATRRAKIERAGIVADEALDHLPDPQSSTEGRSK